MAHSSRHYIHFLQAGTLGITVTAPTSGGTVTTAGPVVTWTVAGGTGIQASYRVFVFADAAGTQLVYDSGWVTSNVLQHTIITGALLNGHTYYLRVISTDSDGAQGESDFVDFTTDIATSVDVSGVTLRKIDGCTDPRSLPRVELRWTQVTPGAGETFVEYRILRREPDSDVWVAVGTVDDVATTRYRDYNAAPGIMYEYSVVWVASTLSGDLISDVAGQFAELIFDHAWLHDVNDPEAYHVRLDATQFKLKEHSDTTFQSVWGRPQPSAVFGEEHYFEVDVELLPQPLKTHKQWDKLSTILTRQRENASTLCYRHGESETRLFCALSPRTRDVAQVVSTATVTLTETYYEEEENE